MKRTAPLLLALLLLCLVGCARPSAGAFALYQQAYEKLAASRSYEMDITMSLAGRAGAEEMQLGMDLRICQAQRSGHTLPDTAANLTLRITGLSITVDVYAREDSIYVAALGQKMRMNVEEALAAAGGADASRPSGDEPPSFLPLSNEYVTDGSVLANGMGRRVFFQIDSEAFLAAQMLEGGEDIFALLREGGAVLELDDARAEVLIDWQGNLERIELAQFFVFAAEGERFVGDATMVLDVRNINRTTVVFPEDLDTYPEEKGFLPDALPGARFLALPHPPNHAI